MTSHTMVRREDGFAVIVAMMGLVMIGALGTALVLATSVETMIARSFRDGAGALYAADAAAAHATQELSATADWTTVLTGSTRSVLVDGMPDGVRRLDDGSTISLTEILNLANCGKMTACSGEDLIATDSDRAWGTNNPHWQLFAWGRLADLVGVASPFYVIVLVADDPAETDGNPLVDGSGSGNPGSGVLALRAEAFAPGGRHGVVEMTVARIEPDELDSNPEPRRVRVVSWRAGQ